jgi:hypothetical protein
MPLNSKDLLKKGKICTRGGGGLGQNPQKIKKK